MKQWLCGMVPVALVVLSCTMGPTEPPGAAWPAGGVPVNNLGITINREERGYRVVAVHEGSPAQNAGFTRGDLIVAVNSWRLPSMSAEEAVSAVGGAPQLEKEYLFLRGAYSHVLTITLDQYYIPDGEMLFCWWFMEDYFIFRDDLPMRPFRYQTPAALYNSVQDPYTVYYDSEFATLFLSWLTTETAGMGIVIDSSSQGYRMVDVIPSSPAHEAGLERGDIITAVDGAAVAGRTYEETLTLLRGLRGEQRTLEVLRDGARLSFTVTLGSFLSRSVWVDSLDDAVASIRLSSFSSTTALPGGTVAEFVSALQQTMWARALILDLRGNPGGAVDQCVGVASELLDDMTPLVRVWEREYYLPTNSMRTVDTVWKSSGGMGLTKGRTMLVLVDGETASAAEVILAAVQTHRPDVVSVGERTWGKARGQVFIDTPDSGIAKVTYAYMEPLAAATWDLVGITPDVVLDDEEDDALLVALGSIESALGRRVARPGPSHLRARVDAPVAKTPPLCVVSKATSPRYR